jgi:macrolide-specific efflux system membrane fusion protein
MWTANRKFINDAVSRSLLSDDPTYIQENDDWLAAEAKYKNQQKVINQAQIALNAAWLAYQQASPIIYAPISGTVTGLSLQPGTVLVAQANTSGTATAQKIASIRTNAAAQLSVNITEVDITKIKIGDKATVTLDALPGKTYTGKVVSIDTIGMISSGVTNYPAVIGLDTEVPAILPNMAVNVQIITKVLDNVILVPNAAVQTTNGQTTVRVMRNGQVAGVEVEVAGSNETQTGLASGINEGEVVVTSALSSTRTSQTQRQGTSSVFGGLGGGAFRMGR